MIVTTVIQLAVFFTVKLEVFPELYVNQPYIGCVYVTPFCKFGHCHVNIDHVIASGVNIVTVHSSLTPRYALTDTKSTTKVSINIPTEASDA